jgi:hypothetical protein
LFAADLPENILYLAQQRPALGLVFHPRRSLQLLQQLTLALVKLARSLNPKLDEQVAFSVTIQHGYAFSPDAHRSARLRPIRHLEGVFAVERWHSNLRA